MKCLYFTYTYIEIDFKWFNWDLNIVLIFFKIDGVFLQNQNHNLADYYVTVSSSIKSYFFRDANNILYKKYIFLLKITDYFFSNC